MIEANKCGDLDYLKLANMGRKIFLAFDPDCKGKLQDPGALLNHLVREFAAQDVTLNVGQLREKMRHLNSKPTIRTFLDGLLSFFGIQKPEKEAADGELPGHVKMKSAQVGRVIAKTSPQRSMSKSQVERFLRKIWRNYGSDGYGLADEGEARHFVSQYLL